MDKKDNNVLDYRDIQPARKVIVSDNDKVYGDVSKVEKRVYSTDLEHKNYSEVTHDKKRVINQREYIEIEGSKPKKIQYQKHQPELMVVMHGDDGPKFLRKCIKT